MQPVNPTEPRFSPILSGLILLAVGVMAALIVLPLLVGPLALEWNQSGAPIHFMAERRWVLLPGDCVTVRWQTEGVQAVYLNDQGVAGVGEQQFCLERGDMPRLRVALANGQARTYRLPVGIAVFSAELWIALGAAALAIVLAAREGDVPGLQARWRMLAAGLLLIGAAGMVGVFALLERAPDAIDVSVGDSRIAFVAADLPGGCVRVRWSAEYVRALYLNGEGVPGEGERDLCPAPGDRRFGETLRVDLPDGGSREYVLNRRLDRWLLLILAAGMILLAGRLVSIPLLSRLSRAVLVRLPHGAARLLASVRRLALAEDEAPGGPDESTVRLDLLAATGLILAVAVVFGPVIGAQAVVHDYLQHVDFARQIYLTGTLNPVLSSGASFASGDVRFLYQALTIAAYALIPRIDFMTAGLLVVVIAIAVLGVLLYAGVSAAFVRIDPDRGLTFPAALASALIAFGLLLVAPVNLFSAAQNALYFTYIPITVYQSPTVIVLKPLALLLFWYAVRAVALNPRPVLSQGEGEKRRYVRMRAALIAGGVVVLALLAKPNHVIALLPALAVLVLYRLWRREAVNWRLLLGIALPAAVVLGVQYAATYGRADQGSILFAPFVVRDFQAPRATLLPGLVLSILFPLAVGGLYFRTARRNTALVLAWLAFLTGAFYTYFLAEDGYMLTHWNFGWSGQVTLFVLFVASAQYLIGQLPPTVGKITALPGRLLLCALAFGLHLLGGVIWYTFNLSPGATLWWMTPEL